MSSTLSGRPAPQLLSAEDRAVARNTLFNDMVGDLRTVNPQMAKQIEGVSAVGAQSNWMLIATPIVTFLSVKYFAGNLDPATSNLLAGLLSAGLTSVVGIIWRIFFTIAPVTSLLPRPADAPPNVPTTSPTPSAQG